MIGRDREGPRLPSAGEAGGRQPRPDRPAGAGRGLSGEVRSSAARRRPRSSVACDRGYASGRVVHDHRRSRQRRRSDLPGIVLSQRRCRRISDGQRQPIARRRRRGSRRARRPGRPPRLPDRRVAQVPGGAPRARLRVGPRRQRRRAARTARRAACRRGAIGGSAARRVEQRLGVEAEQARGERAVREPLLRRRGERARMRVARRQATPRPGRRSTAAPARCGRGSPVVSAAACRRGRWSPRQRIVSGRRRSRATERGGVGGHPPRRRPSGSRGVWPSCCEVAVDDPRQVGRRAAAQAAGRAARADPGSRSRRSPGRDRSRSTVVAPSTSGALSQQRRAG